MPKNIKMSEKPFDTTGLKQKLDSGTIIPPVIVYVKTNNKSLTEFKSSKGIEKLKPK